MKKDITVLAVVILISCIFNICASAENNDEGYNEISVETADIITETEIIETSINEKEENTETVIPEVPVQSEKPTEDAVNNNMHSPIPTEDAINNDTHSPIPTEDAVNNDMHSPIPTDNPTDNTSDNEVQLPAQNGEADKTELIHKTFMGIINSDTLLRFKEVGEKIELSDLPLTCNAHIGGTDVMECTIDWEEGLQTNTSSVGRMLVRGNVIPQKGYIFNNDAVIEMPFLIYDKNDEAFEEADVINNTISRIIIPINTNPLEYVNKNNKVAFETIHGDIFYAKIKWDEQDISNNKGEFSIYGDYILPGGVYIKDNARAQQNFFAMRDDIISLACPEIEQGNIVCEWIKQIEDSYNINIYYSIDDNEWNIDTDEDYAFAFDNGLCIITQMLEKNTDYYFKLEYEDVFSDILHVNIGNEDIKTDLIEGDRDGGDNGEQPMPPVTLPGTGGGSHSSSSHSGGTVQIGTLGNTVTEKTQENNEALTENIDIKANALSDKKISDSMNRATVEDRKTASEKLISVWKKNENEKIASTASNEKIEDVQYRVVNEELRDDTSRITGERLETMEQLNGGRAAFEKNGIFIELPENFSKKNNISPYDTVDVIIKNHNGNVKISAEVNSETADISDTLMMILDVEAEVLKNGENIEPISIEDDTAVFSVDGNSEYVVNDYKPENAVSHKKYKLAAAGIILVCSAAAVFLRRYYYKK